MTQNDTQMSMFVGEDVELVEEKPNKNKKGKLVMKESNGKHLVNLDLLEKNPLNEMIYLNKDVEKLKASIRKYGYQDSNILCKKLENGRYMIISGHRRVQALKELMLEDSSFNKLYPVTLVHDDELDEVNMLVDMNLSGRELEESEKLNQIFFKVLELKTENENIVDINIVRELVTITGLGESQLKKYIRMFNEFEYNQSLILEHLKKFGTVNMWDKERSIKSANDENNFIITKKVEEPFDGNELFVKEPSKHFQTKLNKVIQQQEKLINLLDGLYKFKDLSKKGSKSVQSMLTKNKTIKSLLDDFITK